LRNKHKQSGQGYARYPDEYLYNTVGLIRLTGHKRNFPRAKA